MASVSYIESISKNPCFQGCSKDSLLKISECSEVIRFPIGHSLSTNKFVPNRVLLLLSGKARLLGRNDRQLITLTFLSTGDIVGLASQLRGSGCEEVSASTEVTALSIPDTLIADLYKNETSFRDWCNNSVFKGEIYELIKFLESESSCQSLSDSDNLDVLTKSTLTATRINIH